MDKILSLTSLLCAFGFCNPAFASCNNYKSPELLSDAQFRAKDFGALGIRIYTNRIANFSSTGCYEMDSNYSDSYRFYINSTSPEPHPSYAAIAVTKVNLGSSENSPAFSLELFRNPSNGNAESGSWIKSIRDEKNYKPGSTISGENFDLVLNGYQSEKPFNVDPLTGYKALDLNNSPPESKQWHALLTDINSTPDSYAVYKVLGNSRSYINDITSYIDNLPRTNTAWTKIYLLKFAAKADGNLTSPLVKISPADCIYIDYRVDGGSEIPIALGDGYDFLVLRFNKKASC